MSRLLDATGLICPMPVLKARKALTDMEPGEELQVLTTDPAAPKDFEAFCEATGHRLLSVTAEDDVSRFVIAKRLPIQY
ncbi:MAG: sulfurtransferase TusA family protein [Pseudomonadota bacterium]